MPFADACGGVALAFRHLRQSDLIGVETVCVPGKQDARDGYAHVVGACQKAGAGHGADGGGVKARKLAALARHAVQVGRFELGVSKGSDVPVAEVIGEDQDHIGFSGGGRCGMQRGAA